MAARIVICNILLLFSGGKLVDPSPETERELKQELLKLAKQFGGKEGVDMTKFPDFKFLGTYFLNYL